MANSIDLNTKSLSDDSGHHTLSEAYLREIISEARQKSGDPAIAVAVMNSTDIYQQVTLGVRVAGKPDSVTANNYFHIGSCSKSVLAVIAAKLVEQGEISWETRFFELFPELVKDADKAYLEITLEEDSKGVTKHIVIPRLEPCSKCHGSGAESESDIVNCPDCNGSGMQRRTQRTPFGIFSTTTTCGKCRGQGKYIKKECAVCDGTGVVKKTRKIEIKVPAGAEEGTNLRVVKEGEAGEKGAESGDLYIIIHVKEHEIFERHGDDIYIKIPIPFTIAALGGEIEVPTLEGKAKLKIPSSTQNNTIFRMKGKGIPYLHGHGTGNENVEVIVEVPKKLSKKQKELLKEFGKESKKKGFLGKIF